MFVAILVAGSLPYVALVLRPGWYARRRDRLLLAARCACGVLAGLTYIDGVWAATAAQTMRGLYARPTASIVWGYLLVPAMQQLALPLQLAGSPFNVLHGFAMTAHMHAAAGRREPGRLLLHCCLYEACACVTAALLEARMRARFVRASGAAAASVG